MSPLNYYRPWSHMMDKRCNLPLAPVSSHRLRWPVLFHLVSQLGIQMDYLQSAYDVCHVLQQYDLTLPRFLPKYDQPKYPRARHLKIRDLGILMSTMVSAETVEYTGPPLAFGTQVVQPVLQICDGLLYSDQAGLPHSGTSGQYPLLSPLHVIS